MNLGPFVFQQPIWFLLLIPMLVTMFVWQMPSRFMTVLRGLLLFLIILTMTQPQLLIPMRSGTLVIVADRSCSMPNDVEESQIKTIGILMDQMGRQDRLAVVSFGVNAAVDRNPKDRSEAFTKYESEPLRDASDLHSAIDRALSLIPVGDSGRLLVLSDGRWTGRKPNDLAARALQRNIPIDYRLQERSPAGDVAILSLETPASVLPGEAFTMTAWVRVPVAQDIEFELLHNDKVIASGKRTMPSGDGRFVFRDRAGSPGSIQYTLRVRGSVDDPVSENNRLQKIVGVEGSKPILLVNPTGKSKLAEILQSSGMRTEVKKGEQLNWTLQSLSNYSGIILENADAKELGMTGLNLVPEWVRNTGAGLMMTGGRSSFALGGYYNTKVGEILPVSMELRKEHRKLASAIVVALDRSGSMQVSVGGGRVKMDLANMGTVEVIRMLSTMDEIGVIAVDSAPHEVIRFGQNSDPETFAGRVLKIESMGGGIFIYEALLRATQMLQNAQSSTRHIILFADAADAEEPGQYVELLKRARESGITCSVIGLGTEYDSDAEFLKDVAFLGGGNCYFSSDPSELPRLFTQDTFTMARNTFLEDATPFRFTGGMATLTGQMFPDPPNVGGLNLCYAKPEALVSALTTDEYKSPMIASWQRGLGRVLTYAAQVDGKYTGEIATWEKYPTMLASLARWTMGGGEKLPDNMLLTQEVRDGSCVVRLHLDPEREQASLDAFPEVIAIRQLESQMLPAETTKMYWVDPDTLEAVIPLVGEETLVATLSLNDRQKTPPVALSPICLPYSPEFQPVEPGRGRDSLKELAEITQGKERIDLAPVWGEMSRVPRLYDLGRWLLYVAACTFLLEVLQRRTGLVVAWWQRGWQRSAMTVSRLFARSRQSKRKAAVFGDGRQRPAPHESDELQTGSQAGLQDGSQKMSWLAQWRLNRQQNSAMQTAKRRAAEQTDASERTIKPKRTATNETTTTAPDKKQPSQTGKPPDGETSMLDALAKAYRAAKDRTKE
ncbi:MAG: VWA domain-containing protein [Planctomycetaceae bacterium]|nr:VWA domain-containing protein [Planctomycetaceae bacterium]